MPDFSDECLAILRLLKDRHNVLISGPPATGKSRLLGEVARAFEASAPAGPVHVPGAVVSIPKSPPIVVALKDALPSALRPNRKVFRTVFHQNSKYRDFLTGLMPQVGAGAGGGTTTFRITPGTLYRASEHAGTPDGASLLIIDEINRGPAVQIFGGSIVAMESDKRLAPDGTRRAETQSFELLRPPNGDMVEYALPHHLYILAAMNQADTSVEPLDVAFLRRWTPFRLDPVSQVLRAHFGLDSEPPKTDLPPQPAKPSDVYEAAARAWGAVNERIRRGRGPEFQIGHGVLMADAPAQGLDEALRAIAESWRSVQAHIDEVFFGDVRGVAAVLNVGNSTSDKHPYWLEDFSFADEPRLFLVGPDVVGPGEIYELLRAIAE